MEPKRRVFFAEDQVMMREALRHCINRCGHEVVGEAMSVQEARVVIPQCRPEVVLLDFQLPDGDGCEVAEFARSHWPLVQILMISGHCEGYTVMRIERVRVDGFVDKDTEPMQALQLAFEALGRGETYFSRAYLEAKRALGRDPDSIAKILTPHECEVLGWIGQSMSNKEIAVRIHRSPQTVHGYRKQLMRKLGVHSTTKLIQFAQQHGFAAMRSRRPGQ